MEENTEKRIKRNYNPTERFKEHFAWNDFTFLLHTLKLFAQQSTYFEGLINYINIRDINTF